MLDCYILTILSANSREGQPFRPSYFFIASGWQCKRLSIDSKTGETVHLFNKAQSSVNHCQKLCLVLVTRPGSEQTLAARIVRIHVEDGLSANCQLPPQELFSHSLHETVKF